MDEKVIIISVVLVGILLLIVVLLAILGTRKNQPASNATPVDQAPMITPVGNSIGGGSVNLPIGGNEEEEKSNEPFLLEGSPEFVARDFYKWYRGHTNPLGSGAYNTNPGISAAYKEILADFVIQGDYQENDPVLTCVNVTPPDTVVPLAAEMNGPKNKASVSLQEEKGLKRVLYEVILTKEGKVWQVEDVRCTL